MGWTRNLLVAAAIAGLGACSSETGGGGGGDDVDRDPPPDGACYQDPVACPDGTTCAFDDENGASMSCLPAGEGRAGDTCQNVAGEPVCGERLVCIQLSGQETGSCARYCDGASDCTAGLTCAKVDTSGGQQFWACVDL